jgi:hypothetical protein
MRNDSDGKEIPLEGLYGHLREFLFIIYSRTVTLLWSGSLGPNGTNNSKNTLMLSGGQGENYFKNLDFSSTISYNPARLKFF